MKKTEPVCLFSSLIPHPSSLHCGGLAMMRTTGRLVFLAVWGAALAFTLGCGGTDKKVAQLKGKVTFKGQPVPAGYISFTPDATKGNQGSVKVAQIKDGEYDTSVAT